MKKKDLKKTSKIIWFTGISGVGKTTLSNALFNKLKKKYRIKKIDGDIFRKKNKIKKIFTKKNILYNHKKIINYIKEISPKYDLILVSVISPLRKTRLIAKKEFNKNYYEINAKCSFKTLNARDTKGLYFKANLGKINLIGYNSKIKYEKSIYKVITINTNILTIKESLNKILLKTKINFN
tara:strand:+ start:120 stop:662 length:543 start_codon:yes stop_codon:yes gene_type:complete